MNNFIQSIIDEIKRHFSSSKIQTTKKWSYLIPLIVVCLLGIIGEYVLLLPIHYQSQTFIFHLIFLAFRFLQTAFSLIFLPTLTDDLPDILTELFGSDSLPGIITELFGSGSDFVTLTVFPFT